MTVLVPPLADVADVALRAPVIVMIIGSPHLDKSNGNNKNNEQLILEYDVLYWGGGGVGQSAASFQRVVNHHTEG